MNNDRRGPWDAPLKDYNRGLQIVILIYDIKKDKIETHYKLDYGNHEDRKFLGRITFWAVTNERSVETMSLEEFNKEYPKGV